MGCAAKIFTDTKYVELILGQNYVFGLMNISICWNSDYVNNIVLVLMLPSVYALYILNEELELLCVWWCQTERALTLSRELMTQEFP